MKHLAVTLMLVALGFCLSGRETAAVAQIDSGAGQPATEVNYTFEAPVGLSHLTYRRQSSSLLFRIDGPTNAAVPVGTQAELLEVLLGKFIADSSQPPVLFVVFRDTSDLFRRLDESALAAPEWNAATGRPESGTVNKFIVDAINAKRLARELAASFEAIGYRLSANSAEEIIVGPLRADAPSTVPLSGVIGFIATRTSAK